MPDFDRHWKLYAISGPLWIVGCFVVAAALVANTILVNWQVGNDLLSGVDFGQAWQILWASFFGVFARAEARRARSRHEHRARFMAGDETAIPLAKDPLAHPVDPVVRVLPFELSGPSLTGTSVATVLIGFTLVILMVLAPIALVLMGFILSSPSINDTQVSGPLVVFIALGVAAFVEFLLVIGLRRISRDPLSRRLIATEDGLVKPRGKRSPKVLRWHDARLFEVIASRGQSYKRAFALESGSATIVWYEWPKTDPARMRDFLAIVRERSGLPMRTLSSEQEETSAVVVNGPLAPTRVPRAFYIVSALAALLSFSLGGLVFLLPLTGSYLVDGLAAFSFAAPGARLLFYALRGLSRVSRGSLVPFVLPPTPDLASRTAVFDNWVSPFRKFFNGALAALFALDVVAALVAGAGVSIQWPGPSIGHRVQVPSALVAVIVTVALVAVVIACSVATGRANRISADVSGVVARQGRKETRIDWGEASRLSINFDTDGEPGFALLSESGTAISWHVGSERRFTPPLGAFRVTADELAAIVVQRSGKPLTLAQE